MVTNRRGRNTRDTQKTIRCPGIRSQIGERAIGSGGIRRDAETSTERERAAVGTKLRRNVVDDGESTPNRGQWRLHKRQTVRHQRKSVIITKT